MKNDMLFPLDLSIIKDNITSYSSSKLADMIIAHRYLILSNELCEIAMGELSRRRMAGDDFDFEEYISLGLKGLPKINTASQNFGLTDIVSLLKGKRK